MNSYQDQFSDVMTDYEPETDLRDLLASVLLHWKTIFACFLIFSLLGCGASYLEGFIESKPVDLRTKLTEEQAAEIENLKAYYSAYEKYLQRLQSEHTLYLENASKKGGSVLQYASYHLSSSLESLESILTMTTLSEDDYGAMRAACTARETFPSIYDRITIDCSESSGFLRTSILSHDETLVWNNDGFNYFILVTIFGSSETECEAMLAIVEAAMERSVDTLRSIDPGIQLSLIDETFSYDTRVFFDQKIDRLSTLRGQITMMQEDISARMEQFSDAEKEYFDALGKHDDLLIVSKSAPEKKYILLSAFVGLILGLALNCLRYLYDSTIKTPDECEMLFSAQVLQRISLSEKRNLFGKWALGLTGVDLSPPEEKIRLLVADILLLTSKSGCKRLFLLCDSKDEKAYEIVASIRERLTSETDGLELFIGDPVVSVDGMEQLANAEEAIVFSQLKHSRRSKLISWHDLCLRYHVSVIGNTTVEICW